jgi:hypothetical protein
MYKLLIALKQLVSRSFLALNLLGLVILISMLLIQSGYALAYDVKTQTEEKVIQPFELTQPASNREEAYEKVAKASADPEKLIKAENKEVKAETNAYNKGRPSNNLLDKTEESLKQLTKN